MATTKEDQAEVLYYGTSVAHAEANLSDIPTNNRSYITEGPYIFPELEVNELRRIIESHNYNHS